MEWFDPMRDFFASRGMRHYAMTVSLPEVDIVARRVKSQAHSFAYPAPAYMALIEANGVVGHVHYGLSPLRDRLYIYRLEIEPEHRRQGLALSTLWRLHLQFRLPLVSLQPVSAFWASAAVILGQAGAHMSTAHASLESCRWALLQPFEECLPPIGEFLESPQWAGILNAMGAA